MAIYEFLKMLSSEEKHGLGKNINLGYSYLKN
jgi:hypothetical protein